LLTDSSTAQRVAPQFSAFPATTVPPAAARPPDATVPTKHTATLYESAITVTKHTTIVVANVTAPIIWRERIGHLTKNSKFGPTWIEHHHWPREEAAKTSAAAAVLGSVPTTRCRVNSSNFDRTHLQVACSADDSKEVGTEHFAAMWNSLGRSLVPQLPPESKAAHEKASAIARAVAIAVAKGEKRVR
jgi:hypothetical protein